jgi:PDZ domain/Aspartyl protease
MGRRAATQTTALTAPRKPALFEFALALAERGGDAVYFMGGEGGDRRRSALDASGLPDKIVLSEKMYHLTAFRLLTVCALIASSCAKAQRLENRPPPTSTSDSQIATIPADVLLGGGLLLQARVNDSEPLWFALDSGGGSGFIIDSRRAKVLGLELQGGGESTGAGEHSVKFSYAENVNINLPGAALPPQKVAVIALDALEPFAGRELDGIIGYGLFSRYVVEVDYAAHRINLYDPQGYRYSGSGVRLPLTVEKDHFFIPVWITMPNRTPIGARVMVDSGAPTATIVLNRPFVEKQNLLAGAGRMFLDRSLPGLGGETKQLLSRASEVRLGTLSIPNPTITFSQDAAGSLADPTFDGIIGGELLRRFKVVFDAPHRQLILEPNAYFNEPYEHNMSGAGLRAEGKDFRTVRINRIIADSPAAQAGLREGDVLVSVDGKPSSDFTLSQLYGMFKQEGREYVFGIARGQAKFQTKIKLRRLA